MRSRIAGSILCVLVALGSTALAQTELTVMTFNIWGGGANARKPIDETVAAIRAVDPDIIGVQETRVETDPCEADSCPPAGRSVARDIAAALGYHYYDQTANNAALWANAVISRYPFVGRSTANDTGIAVDVQGRRVQIFNVHLPDSPYQPYQLLGISYGSQPRLRTARQAIRAARAARGAGIELLFADMARADRADAVFVFGDFNEPSHRDWTAATVRAGLQPLEVAFPSVRAIEHRGFTDLFRRAHPDPVVRPGFTWTPTTTPQDPTDHHDRIDFILAKARSLQVLAAGIVGEKAPEADIVVSPWPSDHRATYARVRF